MKKFLKRNFMLLLSISILCSYLYSNTSIVYANSNTLNFDNAYSNIYIKGQWGQEHCPGFNKCYGCKAPDCQVYSVQKISIKFSYNDCKKIVKKAQSISDFSSYTSMIIGLKSTVAGIYLGLYGMSVSKNVKMFQTAVNKKKGLKLSYEYVINKRSYSLNQYRKVKKSYY